MSLWFCIIIIRRDWDSVKGEAYLRYLCRLCHIHNCTLIPDIIVLLPKNLAANFDIPAKWTNGKDIYSHYGLHYWLKKKRLERNKQNKKIFETTDWLHSHSVFYWSNLFIDEGDLQPYLLAAELMLSGPQLFKTRELKFCSY